MALNIQPYIKKWTRVRCVQYAGATTWADIQTQFPAFAARCVFDAGAQTLQFEDYNGTIIVCHPTDWIGLDLNNDVTAWTNEYFQAMYESSPV